MSEQASFDPELPDNITMRHEADAINKLVDTELISRSEASNFTYNNEFEKPEARESAFDIEARRLMKGLLEETRADTNPTFEKYKEKAKECLENIQKLSRERGGEDHTLWLNFQMALANDHFSDRIAQFHVQYLKRLDILTDMINAITDDEIAAYWAYKLKDYFPDQIKLITKFDVSEQHTLY